MQTNTDFLASLIAHFILAPFAAKNVTWEELKTPVEQCAHLLINHLDEATVTELATGADLKYLGLEDEDELFKKEVLQYFGTTLSEASEIQRNVIIAWRVLVNATSDRLLATRGNIFD